MRTAPSLTRWPVLGGPRRLNKFDVAGVKRDRSVSAVVVGGVVVDPHPSAGCGDDLVAVIAPHRPDDVANLELMRCCNHRMSPA